MRRMPDVDAARFEPLETRVLLDADGLHAVAVEFDPDDGLRFGSASETATIVGSSFDFGAGLTFTFDDDTTSDNIQGLNFLGQGSTYDIGVEFGPGGDPYEERTSVGWVDGRPGFTFGRTQATGAWSLIIFAPFDLRDGSIDEIAGEYATGITLANADGDPILGAGFSVIGGEALVAGFLANDPGVGVGFSEVIEQINEDGSIELTSGGSAFIGLDSGAIFGRNVGSDGAIIAGFRRMPGQTGVTGDMLVGSTYAVTMYANDKFLDPMDVDDGLPFDAGRSTIRFRNDGLVERFTFDPEFVPLNPMPDEIGTYSVTAGNIVEVRWQGPDSSIIVSRFEVSQDLDSLLPITSSINGVNLDFAFGIGVRTHQDLDLPPLDPPNPPPPPPDDPGDPGGMPGDPGDGMGEGQPGGPPVPRLEDMESVSAIHDPITGRVTLLVEFQSEGEPTFDVVELWRQVTPQFTSLPAVTLAGDGSAIYLVGATDAGIISIASRADGTFIWEEIISDQDDPSMTGAVISTMGGRAPGASAFADSNAWLVGLRRTADDSAHLLRAIGDVDADGLMEFDHMPISDLAISPDGPVPPIFANTAATLLHTPWRTRAYIYVSDGDIWAIWKHKQTGTWRANNLSLAAGTVDPAHPGAGIAATATRWGTMHITFATQEGEFRQLWWEAGRRTWLEHATGETLGVALAAPTAAFFDPSSRSINFLAVDQDAGSEVLVTWDVQSGIWQTLNFADAIGDEPRRFFARQFVRTVSGRVDLVGGAGTDLRPEVVWASNLALTFNDDMGATLHTTYVVDDIALTADVGQFATQNLARYDPLTLNL